MLAIISQSKGVRPTKHKGSFVYMEEFGRNQSKF